MAAWDAIDGYPAQFYWSSRHMGGLRSVATRQEAGSKPVLCVMMPAPVQSRTVYFKNTYEGAQLP